VTAAVVPHPDASGPHPFVSSGGYSWARNGCSVAADDFAVPSAEPGCHSSWLELTDGAGNSYLGAGTYQDARGDNAHRANFYVAPDGLGSGPAVGATADTNYQPIPGNQCDLESTALYGIDEVLFLTGQGGPTCTLDPTQWNQPSAPPSAAVQTDLQRPHPATVLGLLTDAQLYFAGDDNLNSGEHDGVDGNYGTANSFNGPSDGGSVGVHWHPLQSVSWARTARHSVHDGDLAAVAENPVPVADAGGGACADGVCFGVYTRQTSLYRGGGGSGSSRDVYNYQGKQWDPYDCSSGDAASEQACYQEGGQTMDQYRADEASNVNAEPGVQVYEDPDPQGSPVLPQSMYPLTAVYAGTCGVAAGGGMVQAPASPLTNGAGQVSLSPTGC
jgi:hypothetical protein